MHIGVALIPCAALPTLSVGWVSIAAPPIGSVTYRRDRDACEPPQIGTSGMGGPGIVGALTARYSLARGGSNSGVVRFDERRCGG
jgi:hypothetical protein